jgi:hypothetical protein
MESNIEIKTNEIIIGCATTSKIKSEIIHKLLSEDTLKIEQEITHTDKIPPSEIQPKKEQNKTTSNRPVVRRIVQPASIPMQTSQSFINKQQSSTKRSLPSSNKQQSSINQSQIHNLTTLSAILNVNKK